MTGVGNSYKLITGHHKVTAIRQVTDYCRVIHISFSLPKFQTPKGCLFYITFTIFFRCTVLSLSDIKQQRPECEDDLRESLLE